MKRISTLITILTAVVFVWACGKEEQNGNQSGDEPANHDQEEPFAASGTIGGHEYVDLGLSVKWATCNLGAQNLWETGNYYAWGDTKPYTEWTYANYGFSFVPCSPDYVLDAQWDAVTANWGTSWRTPTKEEIDELINTAYEMSKEK